jgi:hypothetical protein
MKGVIMGKKIIILMILILLLPVALFAENRTALIIGNSGYRNAPLRNPANDAEDIAAKLEGLGFAVTLLQDAGKGKMDSAVRTFTSDLTRKKGVVSINSSGESNGLSPMSNFLNCRN